MENKEEFQLNNNGGDYGDDYGVTPADDGATAKKKRRVSKILTILLFVALVAFVGALLLRWFWISNIGVAGISMMPNYKGDDGDRDTVWVNKAVDVKRGDVVVFYVNEVNKFLGEFASGRDVQSGGKYEKYIKRVVALSGDKIWWERVPDDENRCVLVIKTPDGRELRENQGDNVYYRHGKQAQFYVTNGGETSSVPYFLVPAMGNNLYGHDSEEHALVIEDGRMFVMGDNRYASHDSRAIGAVPLSHVYGVVINP